MSNSGANLAGAFAPISVASDSKVIAETHLQSVVQNSTQVESNVVAFALPADVAAGDVFEVRAGGTLAHSAGSAQDYQVRLRVGASALTPATVSIPANANPRRWSFVGTVHVGESGAGAMYGELRVADAGTLSLAPTTIALNGFGTVAGIAGGTSVALTAQIFTSLGYMSCSGAALRRIGRAAAVSHIFNSATISRGGSSFLVSSPSQEWNVKKIAAAVDRFEIRSGDYLQTDGALKERAEAALSGVKYPFSTDIWISYALYVEGGAVSTADWVVLGQCQRTFDAGDLITSPPFEMALYGPDLVCNTRSDPNDPTTFLPDRIPRWTLANFARDQWHYFVHKLRFEKTTDGHLTTWHNGTQLVDIDIPMGFNDAVGTYFKYGIYRAAAPETIAVRWANVEQGTASLLARVTAPLAIATT